MMTGCGRNAFSGGSIAIIAGSKQKYLTRTILYNGIISGLNIIGTDDAYDVVITPFDVETPSTIYHDGVVIALRADEVTEMLLDDLEQIGRDPRKLHGYIEASDLYPTPQTGAVLIAL